MAEIAKRCSGVPVQGKLRERKTSFAQFRINQLIHLGLVVNTKPGRALGRELTEAGRAALRNYEAQFRT